MKWNEYRTGLGRGLPVGMGYFSVSFGFGAMAVSQGLRVLDTTLISLTNVTSAGQFAGLTVIVAAATLWEMILTQLIINSRYALMSFALAMARVEPLTVPFMLGLGTLPILGWTLGTLCGALAGSILPPSIQAALGVMLYGMFIAIVVPPAKKEKEILITVLLAMALSTLFTLVPLLKQVSAGIAIVICTVVAAAVGAVLFPIPEEEEVNA